jgi:hypothetical protein
MGILDKVFQPEADVQQLPTGSLTVDRNGEVVVFTVSSNYPKDLLHEIGREVLLLFHEARVAQIPLGEINIYYTSLRITARELRGGAVIFLYPQTALTPVPNPSRL